jgi:hypothetical protein
VAIDHVQEFPVDDVIKSPELPLVANVPVKAMFAVPPFSETPMEFPPTVDVTPLLYRVTAPFCAEKARPDVADACVDETMFEPKEKAPVTLLNIIGPDAERDEVVIFELNVDQSVDVRSPRAVEEAEGRLKVCVEPEDTILKSVPEVDEAKSCVVAFSPFNDVIPEPGVPTLSSSQTIVPVAVAINFPPFANEEQLRPEITTPPPGARIRLFEPVVPICGFVAPRMRLPLVRTGISLLLADCAGV